MGYLKSNSSLVDIANGRPMTTSLLVAEMFNRPHKSIISTIARLGCSELFNRQNFLPIGYKDIKGRHQPMFQMTKDGFIFLAMGFTGSKTALFKEAYIGEFNRMQDLLSRQKNLMWREQRERAIESRKVETDAIQEFIDYAVSQGSQRAKTYYVNFTKLTHRALFIMADIHPTPFREILNSMQLNFLATAEYIVTNSLLEGMGHGLHYKEIYQLAKDRVLSFASTVGVTPLYLPEQGGCAPTYCLPKFGEKTQASSGVSNKEVH